MKKILTIAFFYPPSANASVQRILKTTEYLPDFGWEPYVLTAKKSAYDKTEDSQEIPQNIQNNIYRATALDVFRHLSIKGKHIGGLAIVDRWSSWIPFAIMTGLKMIKLHKPDVIWSTTPIPSAHIVARYLSIKSKIPWVADYQDPFHYHYSVIPKWKTKAQKKIDYNTMRDCSAAVFATDRARKKYSGTFGDMVKEKLFFVENGFDENNWQLSEKHHMSCVNPISRDKFSLLYSGALYSNGRDPLPLFTAIKMLKDKKKITPDNFELVFQGAGDGANFYKENNKMSIAEMVKFTKSVPYLDSLLCMKNADALVLIQDDVFDLQVPGKIYEYFRAGRRILSISPSNSATAKVARKYEGSQVAQSAEKIAEILHQWIRYPTMSRCDNTVQKFSRYSKTLEYVKILNQVTTT